MTGAASHVYRTAPQRQPPENRLLIPIAPVYRSPELRRSQNMCKNMFCRSDGEVVMPYSPAHKERTRAKVVECARILFNRHGFDGVTIDMVMEQAELTRGGFYNHFKSKEELFAAAVSSFLMGRGARWRAEAGIDHTRPTREDAANMLAIPASSTMCALFLRRRQRHGGATTTPGSSRSTSPREDVRAARAKVSSWSTCLSFPASIRPATAAARRGWRAG